LCLDNGVSVHLVFLLGHQKRLWKSGRPTGS
jgi:hypothetical protein